MVNEKRKEGLVYITYPKNFLFTKYYIQTKFTEIYIFSFLKFMSELAQKKEIATEVKNTIKA